jgi:glyoxylase-like metal-dependent hydrolase (beta-lactamase superfamily II)
MLRVGDIDIHLVNDGTVLVDGGGPFGLVPRVLWSRYIEPVRDNLIPMTLTCLLVRVDGKTVVIDTGYGTKDVRKLERIVYLERPDGGLLDGLARLGVSPEAVDLVIATHLHADHAGGNTYRDDDGEIRPTFPNAEYVVQRREYEDAIRPNERTRATYLLENYVPLVESGQMRLLDGDTDFFPGVRGVVTRGHTPGHMSVTFERGDDAAMFVCDLSSYAVHMERLGWMTAYDVEPLYTLETKRQWRAWARERDATLIFPHDPARYAGRLTGSDDKPTLERADLAFA